MLIDVEVLSMTQSWQVILMQLRWLLDAWWTDFWPKENKVETQEMPWQSVKKESEASEK